MRFYLLLLAMLVLPLVHGQHMDDGRSSYGSFSGTLTLQPMSDGVHMMVVKTYSYTDNDDHTLTAQSGFQTDGASIPRALWTIAGSPFTGKYIGAAVIHDVGCVWHLYSWQITHRMFYTAMLASGVDPTYAKLLYYGVRVGGPKWEERHFAGKDADELNKQIIKAAGGKYPAGVRYSDVYKGPSHGSFVEAMAPIPIPQEERPLTKEDVDQMLTKIQTREHSESGAMTLDEIDHASPLIVSHADDSIPKQP